MGDNERADLADRITRLEVKFEEHEKGAVTRKDDLALILGEIKRKVDGQQCTLHTARMLEIDAKIEKNRSDADKAIEALHKRITNGASTIAGRVNYIERVMYLGMGGLAVIVFVLDMAIRR